jgi:hypothetical protein
MDHWNGADHSNGDGIGWIMVTGLEWDGSLERGWNGMNPWHGADHSNGAGMAWITGTGLKWDGSLEQR